MEWWCGGWDSEVVGDGDKGDAMRQELRCDEKWTLIWGFVIRDSVCAPLTSAGMPVNRLVRYRCGSPDDFPWSDGAMPLAVRVRSVGMRSLCFSRCFLPWLHCAAWPLHGTHRLDLLPL